MKKTILVTGINGLLGQYLAVRLQHDNFIIHGCGKGDCRLNLPTPVIYHSIDMCNAQEVEVAIHTIQPHIIIHAAAMTNVDDCELEPQQAFKINVQATKMLLQEASKLWCKPHFIFISTDFIFNGKYGPYSEDALPEPINYYGKTKMWGEFLVMQSSLMWSIARTNLVYGRPLSGARNNIVEWIKSKLENKCPLQMVADQFRSPSYLPDVADGVFRIAELTGLGIFNIGGEDMLTPFDIAIQIATFFNLDKALIQQSDSTVFKQPAIRPLRTGLLINKAKKDLKYQPMSFLNSLADMYSIRE